MSIQTKPFSLAGLACLYTAPSCGEQRDTAVLFASAYGYEDLCSRKMLRVMADGLANLGIASLRLDYIGTGDSLDEAHVDGRADWAADLAKAASSLRKNSGAKRLIVVAQGMGSLVAAKAIQDGLVVDGIAHLAPVMSGKSYLRELSMTDWVCVRKIAGVRQAISLVCRCRLLWWSFSQLRSSVTLLFLPPLLSLLPAGAIVLHRVLMVKSCAQVGQTFRVWILQAMMH
jgi:pimeloyl-ACP methyl ester carboxylesterase